MIPEHRFNLQPTKTCKIRRLVWFPYEGEQKGELFIHGIMEIQEQRKKGTMISVYRYLVQEPALDHPLDKILDKILKFTKSGGEEFYWITLSPNGDVCHCIGFLKNGHCKHLEAARLLNNTYYFTFGFLRNRA